jgi:hypothetical protein
LGNFYGPNATMQSTVLGILEVAETVVVTRLPSGPKPSRAEPREWRRWH